MNDRTPADDEVIFAFTSRLYELSGTDSLSIQRLVQSFENRHPELAQRFIAIAYPTSEVADRKDPESDPSDPGVTSGESEPPNARPAFEVEGEKTGSVMLEATAASMASLVAVGWASFMQPSKTKLRRKVAVKILNANKSVDCQQFQTKDSQPPLNCTIRTSCRSSSDTRNLRHRH